MNEVETQNEFLNPFAPPNTPALPAPAREADAHRVKVIAVGPKTFDSGATAIALNLESIDTGASINWNLWPPKMYVEDISVDATTLPEGEPFVDAEGKTKKKGDQRTQYARTVHNSSNSADLDQLLKYAAAQGNAANGTRPESFVDVCNMLNDLLSGVEFIITRRPQRDNPEFLEVNGHRAIGDATNGKFLASLQKRGITPRWM